MTEGAASGEPASETSRAEFLSSLKAVERQPPPKERTDAALADLPPSKPSRKDAVAEVQEEAKDVAAPEAESVPAGDANPGSAKDAKDAGGSKDTKDVSAKPQVAEGTLIGVLDIDQRIRRVAEQNERTLWTGAALATLVYIIAIAGPYIPGISVFFPPPDQQQAQRERRGQDALNSIDVEIVPEPDPNAQTKKWREGTSVPSPQPTDQPPQPAQQTAALPEAVKPPEEKPDDQKTEDQTEPREDTTPLSLDLESLVDAAAADLTKKIDQAFAKKPKKRQEAQVLSGSDLQVRGKGAAGKSNPYTRSVINALLKTRPGPYALFGRVLVSFQIGEGGQVTYVHMLHSSGNTALDEAAVEAIRKARFERPPPGLSPDDRTYIIDYIFG